ncbi:WGR domain-containing protein [Lichenifustis flavocetrariae]|uniref:WGR domain-containing protein n=1 Tax=Lichenifustis flavocetrariae TaxID=2949735 RepID=A0AA41Z3U8_9HYPH|nr:WGR domain-containing protein [Lichenifustis flavocetrariae]MCW6512521.1 WGR domain-containing protein [Lichenifustis flavocetrariae]
MSDALSGSAVSVQLLVLDRIEESSNMARYYVLTVEPTLFGDMALVREWGRIGVSCRRRLDLYPDDAAAKVALDTWLRRKSKRGYVLRDACGPRRLAGTAG